ncbi:unnamed protein product [Symbiodinium sp. CCMP2592]|nr:unnamed protein product [Symbiodinium sp. CCMP2592]
MHKGWQLNEDGQSTHVSESFLDLDKFPMNLDRLAKQFLVWRWLLGFKTEIEEAVPDSTEHQGVRAERYVDLIRRLGLTLLHTVTASTQQAVHSSHPLYSWCFRHAAFLLTRYKVHAEGCTSFEIVHGRKYDSKICAFGSTVFCQFVPKKKVKGVVWEKAVYLGKSSIGDLNIVANASGVHYAQTIRRAAQVYQAEMIVAMKGVPWNPTLDVVAARTKKGGLGRVPLLAPPAVGEVPSPMDVAGSDPPTTPQASQSAESSLLDGMQGQGSSPGSSELIPAAMQVDQVTRDESEESQSFVLRVLDPQQPHGHEEDAVDCDPDEELGNMPIEDEYLCEPTEDLSEQSASDSRGDEGMPWSGRAYDLGPPELSPEELGELDEQMQKKEIDRLLGMGVLKAMMPEEREGKVKLQCKYVLDWRFRNGWVRRARLVAKEYRFLEPTLADLYSPASVACSHKLLGCLFVSGQQLELVSIDVTDAYLQVEQRRPTYIQTPIGDLELLYTLLGQRTGSRDWYDHLAGTLTEGGMDTFKGNPAVFAIPQEVALNSHVDDMQILGVKGAPMALANRLKDKGLKVKIDGPVDVNGGTSHFLKRKFESIEKGLVITQDVKYAERLVGLLELEKANVKRTPMPQQVPEPGVGERLNAEMHALYRKCIGLLLYMSSERPDLQYGVKVLSSRCSDPTQTDFNLLRHLVKYVKLHPVVPVKMDRCNPGRTVFQKWEGRDCEPEDWDPKKYPFGLDHVVEVVTDADWGSKTFPERRSISAYVILINGNVCHCGNKVQKTISLSSAESELMASLLGVTEAMFVAEMVRFICGPNSRVKLVHYVDNSAARSIIQKQGLQRTRHVSLAWLWIQRSHHDGVFVTKPISTKDAPADLRTKSHGRNRLKYLMSLIGMSLDEDDDAGHVRVQRVRARATTVQGSSIAAVMRALAVILEGGEALSFDEERDFRSVHVPIVVVGMIVLGLIGAWSVASTFVEEGGTLTMWVMLFVLVASVGATEIVADDADDGAANFLQRLCDHSGLAALVIALCVLLVVIYMPPRRWNRDRGRGSAQQQPFEPRDGCMTYDDYIHENLFDTWDEVFPRSDDDEGGAAEAYVQSYVHEDDDGGVEDAAQDETQGYVHNDRSGDPRNFDVENQDQDQRPHEPHTDMVYIVGEAKRKKGFHKGSCGMVQRWLADLPENVSQISRAEAQRKGLRPCKQCRP